MKGLLVLVFCVAATMGWDGEGTPKKDYHLYTVEEMPPLFYETVAKDEVS
jgi:hypothetical protein